MQRGHNGPPVQNSVVPGLQPSSSYYSGSTGKFRTQLKKLFYKFVFSNKMKDRFLGGQTGYYQQPGSSSGPQLPQHQAGYGLQGNIFGTHNQSHTNTGMQVKFDSKLLNQNNFNIWS